MIVKKQRFIKGLDKKGFKMAFGNGLKKIAKEISSRYKYVRGKKGLLQSDYEKIKHWQPENEFAKYDKEHTLAWIDLTWFLFCLMKFAAKDTKTLLLDNVLIDEWQKNNKKIKIENSDSDIKIFFKKLQKSNPRVAATLRLWMLYAFVISVGVGGGKLARYAEEQKKNNKELAVKSDKENNLDKNIETEKIYDVQDGNFKENFIDENWSDMVILLLEFESWRKIPKQQYGESRQTYGPGLTWVYLDGEQHECVGKYAKIAEEFTEEQVWDQVRQHCLYPGECFSLMQRGFKEYGLENVSQNQILSLFVAGYQMPSRLRDGTFNKTKKNWRGIKITEKIPYTGILHKLKDAGKNKQNIVDSFIAGEEIESGYREGTNKRRWWCAMCYIGKISTEDLVNMDMDAFSKIKPDSIMKNGHFVYDDETIQYALSLQSPGNKTVREFINESVVLNNTEMLCETNCKSLHYELIAFDEKDKRISKQNLRKKAFDKGVLKIKNKQKNMAVYPYNNEYNG